MMHPGSVALAGFLVALLIDALLEALGQARAHGVFRR